MVKIRLKRMGTKARPFYRVVVAKSDSARDGAFVENIGTYNPVPKEKVVNIKNDRAVHWLMNGAQPTETVAVLLKRSGALDEFFKARPNAKASYKFLDKRTAAMSTKSVIEAPVAVAEAAPAAPVASETPAAPPAEQPEPAPAESPAEAPAEAPADSPSEAPAETPSEGG